MCYAVGAYVPYWLSLLMTSVSRVNHLKIAIAPGSGLEGWPCLSMSRRVTWASELACSIGTRVTRVTRVAQSKSANKCVFIWYFFFRSWFYLMKLCIWGCISVIMNDNTNRTLFYSSFINHIHFVFILLTPH